MLLVLTRKTDGLQIIVDSDMVKMWEPDSDGASTHVVFGPEMVRVVSESLDQIKHALGVTVPL